MTSVSKFLGEAEDPVEHLATLLQSMGIACSVEHPGYVHIPIGSDGNALDVGTVDGFWGYNYSDEEGQDYTHHMEDSEAMEVFRDKDPASVDFDVLAQAVKGLVDASPWAVSSGYAEDPADKLVGEADVSPKTPMMQQYDALKASAPDAILLFRLGDFYEIFGEDAAAAAKILNITLTNRRGTPMAGVPFHSVDQYARKLMAAGKTVAIADAEKGSGHSLRILSTGQQEAVDPKSGELDRALMMSDSSEKLQLLRRLVADRQKKLGGMYGHVSRADLRELQQEIARMTSTE